MVGAFAGIRDNTVFPVSGKSVDDIESAFGPRIQSSTGLYDFHRGIDIDGGSVGSPVGIYNVLAVTDGVFYDYRYSDSGGNTLILKHSFASPIVFQGKTLNYYYSWYLHLYDDGIQGNGVGTADMVSGLKVGDPVSKGTIIGKVGDSGAPSSGEYAPHLHFELRVGTPSSLEFQNANPGTTQWGFDPHMNPLLLFPPYTYGNGGSPNYNQTLTLAQSPQFGKDINIQYQISNDDMPVLNRVEAVLRNTADNSIVTSHTLDLNLRLGYNASSTSTLDSKNLTKPYINPIANPFGSTFSSTIVIPSAWLQNYQDPSYQLTVTTTDVWGNSESLALSMVPEPMSGVWISSLLLSWVLFLKRLSISAKPRKH